MTSNYLVPMALVGDVKVVDRWIDTLRATGLTWRETLVALWVRTSVRALAVRLARQTTLQNSLAVPMLESWLLEGCSAAQALQRVGVGLVVRRVTLS